MSSSAAPSTRNEIAGMARLINVSGELRTDASLLCEELESGNILYFPQTPFSFSDNHLEFLLASKQTGASYHKNIAYRPAADRITGLDKAAGRDAERLRRIMQWYSQQAQRFLAALLPPYAGRWKLDFASYRPLEERGRPARLRARNDLPHVDAFPTRPTNGDRILRLFSNINPQQNRVWITAPNFAAIAPQFAEKIGLPRPLRTNSLAHAIGRVARALHLAGAARSPYDDFMHRCHNAMKEDAVFQESCPKQRWEFPPHSTWIVFTDYVSHAVLEGQYALEQTFIVSQNAMVRPEKSPLAILERLAGRTLTNQN